MLCWQPYPNREIEAIRLRRRTERLERRLADLRRAQTELHRDTIVALEAELATLRGELVGVG